MPEQVKYLSQADYEGILSDLLPTPRLQAQTESALDQAFAYLKSDSPSSGIRVSMTDVKSRVAGDEGVRAALRVVRSWPPCTRAQVAAWSRAGIDQLPACRPPEEIIKAMSPQVKVILAEAAAQIPDDLDLTQAFKGQDESGSAQPSAPKGPDGQWRQELQRVLRAVHLSLLMPIVLLALIALFCVRSVKGLMRWWGIPLLIVGIVGIGLGIATLPVLDWVITQLDVSGRAAAAALSGNLLQAVLDLARHLVGAVATRVTLEAAAIAALGLALLLLSFRPNIRGSLPFRNTLRFNPHPAGWPGATIGIAVEGMPKPAKPRRSRPPQ